MPCKCSTDENPTLRSLVRVRLQEVDFFTVLRLSQIHHPEVLANRRPFLRSASRLPVGVRHHFSTSIPWISARLAKAYVIVPASHLPYALLCGLRGPLRAD